MIGPATYETTGWGDSIRVQSEDAIWRRKGFTFFFFLVVFFISSFFYVFSSSKSASVLGVIRPSPRFHVRMSERIIGVGDVCMAH